MKRYGMIVMLALGWNALIAPCALFRKFPALSSTIAYVPLCDLPTPLLKLEHLGNALGASHVYMKRDDLTGIIKDGNRLYGGNKPRKLEWLLADALQKNARTIITYGCVGSNHAVATATYAQALNLDAILLLKHQPNSTIVQQNLLLDYACNAQMHFFVDAESRDAYCHALTASDPHAYFIPTGGSNTIGTLGFVNAALELSEQIAAGCMPLPARIYLPIGSCATTAGLLLGLQMSGLDSVLVAVAVEQGAYEERTKELFVQTNQLMHELDEKVPLYEFPTQQCIFQKDFSGTVYGLWTQESVFAIQLLKKLEGITCEGTYSAKPLSALIEDLHRGTVACDDVVLVWNTYCGLDFSHRILHETYTQLSSELQWYFRNEVQLLNKVIVLQSDNKE
jgi:D-cysteine desulfhydrase